MFPGNVIVLKLDSSRDLSVALLNLTRTGRGFFEFSLYLPSLRWSRIDRGLMLLSVFVITEVTSFRSCLSLSYFGVPLQHSSMPWITTLNLRSSS